MTRRWIDLTDDALTLGAMEPVEASAAWAVVAQSVTQDALSLADTRYAAEVTAPFVEALASNTATGGDDDPVTWRKVFGIVARCGAGVAMVEAERHDTRAGKVGISYWLALGRAPDVIPSRLRERNADLLQYVAVAGFMLGRHGPGITDALIERLRRQIAP